MTDEIEAVRVEKDGLVFDSVLEFDWYTTLVAWGFEVEHHPGEIPLGGGLVWEPDFAITNASGLVVLGEAKGDHNDRLWKAAEAERAHPRYGGVVVLRAGLTIPESDETGAVWHGVSESGREWVVEFDEDGGAHFTREPRLTSDIRLSAERVWVRPECFGLAFVKGER